MSKVSKSRSKRKKANKKHKKNSVRKVRRTKASARRKQNVKSQQPSCRATPSEKQLSENFRNLQCGTRKRQKHNRYSLKSDHNLEQCSSSRNPTSSRSPSPSASFTRLHNNKTTTRRSSHGSRQLTGVMVLRSGRSKLCVIENPSMSRSKSLRHYVLKKSAYQRSKMADSRRRQAGNDSERQQGRRRKRKASPPPTKSVKKIKKPSTSPSNATIPFPSGAVGCKRRKSCDSSSSDETFYPSPTTRDEDESSDDDFPDEHAVDPSAACSSKRRRRKRRKSCEGSKPSYVSMVKTAIRDLQPYKLTHIEGIRKYIELRYKVKDCKVLKRLLTCLTDMSILKRNGCLYTFNECAKRKSERKEPRQVKRRKSYKCHYLNQREQKRSACPSSRPKACPSRTSRRRKRKSCKKRTRKRKSSARRGCFDGRGRHPNCKRRSCECYAKLMNRKNRVTLGCERVKGPRGGVVRRREYI